MEELQHTFCPECQKNIVSLNYLLHQLRCRGKPSKIQMDRVSTLPSNPRKRRQKQGQMISKQVQKPSAVIQPHKSIIHPKSKYTKDQSYQLDEIQISYEPEEEMKVGCPYCSKQLSQLQLEIHVDYCKFKGESKDKTKHIMKPISHINNPYEQMEEIAARGREKDSKISLSRQSMRRGFSLLDPNVKEDQTKCIRCGETLKITEADNHSELCVSMDVRCQYCDEPYPMYLIQDHINVCESKKFIEQCQNQSQSNYYSQHQPHYVQPLYSQQESQPESPRPGFQNNLMELGSHIFRMFSEMRNSFMLENTEALDSKEIKEIKKVRYERRGEEGDQCCVCFVEFENRENISELRCKHLFHTGCISKWLELSCLCPLCKGNVRKK